MTATGRGAVRVGELIPALDANGNPSLSEFSEVRNCIHCGTCFAAPLRTDRFACWDCIGKGKAYDL